MPRNGIRSETPSCGTLTLVASGAVGVGSIGTTVAGVPCDSISEAVTLPPLPVGVTALMSIFFSFAIRRTAGVAEAFSLDCVSGSAVVLAKLAGTVMLS